MSDPQDTTPTPGPYATAAQVYWKSGWRGILPIPRGQKAPVPTGWTGARGEWPSFPDVQAWIEDNGNGNIALRLPPHILGIDVDMYDGKPGGLVLGALEQQLGPLPATWRTTSRDDGTSGIRLYRIPTGLRWPGGLGPGIDTIRHDHRYAVTWPSIHPAGGTYRWITPDGATTLGTVPNVDDLPDLPTAWVEHFTRGEHATDQPHAGLDTTQAKAWIISRDGGQPPCRHMDTALTRGLTDLTTATSRHDAMLATTNRVIWLTGEGHTGATAALHQLKGAFLKATAGDRAHGAAEAEWDRMVDGAIQIAAAAHPAPSPDPCDDPFHGLIPKENPWTSAAAPTATTRTDAPAPTTSTASPQPSSGSATSSPTPRQNSDSTASNASTSPSPTTSSSASTTETDADDALELQIKRNQYAAQELERLRAQRTAKRLLDEEDEQEAIADRMRSLRITEQAQREWKKQAAGAQEPPEPVILTDLLATPDDPVRYRVEGVWPAGGRVVLAAAAKTGKSTTVGNLIRSLADGDPFLDTFDVAPPAGRVVLIDNELDPRQIKHWLRAQDIADTSRVAVIPLRGRLSTFDILDPITRQEWAGKIAALGGSVIIFDCLRPLIDALGLSEDKDAGRVLVAFDALLADSGADEGLVVHHMGHNGERSRGDTRIRDWPDAEWKLVREKSDDGDTEDDAPRFFSAFGRDVAIPEAKLEFDPLGRRLTIAGGSRLDAKLQPVLDDILDILEANPAGMSERQINDAMADSDHGRNEIRKARKYGIDKGQIATMRGPRKALIHYLNTAKTTDCATSAPPPTGAVNECATADPLKGGSAQWSAKPETSPATTSQVAHSRRPICTACGTTLDAAQELIGATTCTGCREKDKWVPCIVAGGSQWRNVDTGEVREVHP